MKITYNTYRIKDKILKPHFEGCELTGYMLGDIFLRKEDVDNNSNLFEIIDIKVTEWNGTKFGFDVTGFSSSKQVERAMKVTSAALNEDCNNNCCK